MIAKTEKEKIMKKVFVLVLSLLMVLSCLAGCGSSNESTATPNGSSASAETKKKDTLTIGVQLDLDMLDPQNSTQTVSTRMQDLFYQTLLTWSPEKGYQPCLAEKWVWDGNDLVFTIRKGVKFHNGEELKASDVKFSIERVKEVARHASRYIMIKEIKCDDDYTVRMCCESVNDKLVAMLSRVQYGAAIMNEKFTKEAADKITNMVCGTGPYKLVSWTAGDQMVCERFEDYWDEKGVAKTITFKVMSEDTSRVIALENHEIDICETLPKDNYDGIKGTKGLTAYEKESVAITYWGFNMKKEGSPFTNPKVREAMQYAINRDAIMTAVGGSIVYTTVLSSGMEGYDANVGKEHTYNVEKAKELLKEAGYENGFTATLYVKSSDSQTTRAATLINADCEKVGIKIDVQSLESTALMAELKEGHHDSYILTASNVDSYTGFIFFYSGTAPSGGNRMFYGNDEMDQLYEKLPTVSDSAERQKMLTRMQEIAVYDYAWVPLYGQSFYCGALESVQGIRLDSLGFNNYSWAFATE